MSGLLPLLLLLGEVADVLFTFRKSLIEFFVKSHAFIIYEKLESSMILVKFQDLKYFLSVLTFNLCAVNFSLALQDLEFDSIIYS